MGVPIKKQVYDVKCKKFIDHYYYICFVESKNLQFDFDPYEVDVSILFVSSHKIQTLK